MRRLIERFIREPEEPKNLLGFGILWPQVGRTALRYVLRDPSLVEILQRTFSLGKFVADYPEDKVAQYQILEEGFEAAKILRFKQILILFDDFDTENCSEIEMMELFSPLLEKLAHWESLKVFVKCFLPTKLRKPIFDFLMEKRIKTSLIYQTELLWDRNSLRELLVQRLRIGGSRYKFNDFAGPDLENSLEAKLIEAAQDQPRQLLNRVSALIDTHVRYNPDASFFSLDDWNRSKLQGEK